VDQSTPVVAGGPASIYGLSDGVLRVWDRATGELLREWKSATPSPTQFVVFAGDGRSLALRDLSETRIHEIASGEVRCRVRPPGVTFLVAYSSDGRFLACGRGGGEIALFGAATGKWLARWSGGPGIVQSLAFSSDGQRLASGSENGSIIVWKVPEDESLPVAKSAEEAAALWQALSDMDADRAGRALAGLAAASAQAIPLIKERFRAPGEPPDLARLPQLIADLDSETFKVREQASRELVKAGPEAVGLLRKALANNPSVEAKRRIEGLLDRLGKGGDPERLRCLRAIEILERIGTPEATDALRQLGRKPLSAEMHKEIEASLRRMEARLPAAPERSRTP
jgi:hypothetical protein